jgi:hypothetical protein
MGGDDHIFTKNGMIILFEKAEILLDSASKSVSATDVAAIVVVIRVGRRSSRPLSPIAFT